jgi:hypothetical protein
VRKKKVERALVATRSSDRKKTARPLVSGAIMEKT